MTIAFLTATLRAAGIGALLLASHPNAAAQHAPPSSPGELGGIRFSIDTLETPRGWRGPLTRVAGIVEFAAGRGRLSVTGVRRGPTVALNGVIVAAPMATPGDYYLFDSTGFILVRPTTHTFSSFVFTRADYNHSGALLPGAFLMKLIPLHTDTLVAGAAARARQHAPVSIHWHLDSLDARGPFRIYARGWLELQDAPAGEAGVARWFGVAMAIAGMPHGPSVLPRNRLQVTTVALLYRVGDAEYKVRELGLLTPLGLTSVRVDPRRLTLPPGYTESRWPGFVHATGVRAPTRGGATRWRSLPSRPQR